MCTGIKIDYYDGCVLGGIWIMRFQLITMCSICREIIISAVTLWESPCIQSTRSWEYAFTIGIH